MLTSRIPASQRSKDLRAGLQIAIGSDRQMEALLEEFTEAIVKDVAQAYERIIGQRIADALAAERPKVEREMRLKLGKDAVLVEKETRAATLRAVQEQVEQYAGRLASEACDLEYDALCRRDELPQSES